MEVRGWRPADSDGHDLRFRGSQHKAGLKTSHASHQEAAEAATGECGQSLVLYVFTMPGPTWLQAAQ